MKLKQVLETQDFGDYKFQSPEEEMGWIEHRMSYLKDLERRYADFKEKMEEAGKLAWFVDTNDPQEKLKHKVKAANFDGWFWVEEGPQGTKVAKRVLALQNQILNRDSEYKKLKAAKTRVEKIVAAKGFQAKGEDFAVPENIPEFIKLDDGFSRINNPYFHFKNNPNATQFAGPPGNFDWSKQRAYILEYQKTDQALKRLFGSGFEIMYASTVSDETHFALVGGPKGQVVLENDVQFPVALLHFRAARLLKASQFIKQSELAQAETLKRYFNWPPK